MLKFELQTACAGPLCAAISGRGTISAAPDAEGGGEVLLSISKTDGKERQARQAVWRQHKRGKAEWSVRKPPSKQSVPEFLLSANPLERESL